MTQTNLPTYTQALTAEGNTSTAWYRFFAGIAPVGQYSSTFQSGYIQYGGANGTITASINFILGTAIPNPSGTPGPCLLLGSGFGAGGSGTPGQAWIITDEAYDAATPGNTLGITAGETQASGTADGGKLWLIGGASFGGTGGKLQLQGGTSLNGNGGDVVILGGNSTGGAAGDVYVGGGETGTATGNVHLLMDSSGVVRIRVNSTILWDFYPDGSIYCYLGGGFGTAGQSLKSQGPGQPVHWA